MALDRYDLDRLRRALADRCAGLAEALLGPPHFRGRNEWRWGRRGSLALAVAGPRRGLWHDFEHGEGGDMLALYCRVRGGGFAAALEWARNATGERPHHPPAPRAKPHHRESSGRREASGAPPEIDTGRLALDLSRSACETIDGTPAEGYLRSRGIDPCRLPPHPNAEVRTSEHDGFEYAVSHWPPGLRWHAERKLLIVAVNDAETGLIRAVQTIALHPDGAPVLRDGRKMKRTFGPLRGNAARSAWHPDYEHGRWALAEGAETALAAAQMLGCPCWASLGASKLPHVRPPSWARTAVVIADHDEAGLRAAIEAARRFRDLGLKATVIAPERVGADAADMAREAAHAQ